MAIPYCHVCNRNEAEKEAYGESGFDLGIFCPVCHKPVCSHHITTVRWRWKNDRRSVESAKVCQHCRKTYAHRNWDPINRDWAT